MAERQVARYGVTTLFDDTVCSHNVGAGDATAAPIVRVTGRGEFWIS